MMDLTWLIEGAKTLGPVVVLLGFFVYRDKQREERLGSRLDSMQDRYANTMETIVKDNTKAMQDTAEAAKACSVALAANTAVMQRLEITLERKAVSRG